MCFMDDTILLTWPLNQSPQAHPAWVIVDHLNEHSKPGWSVVQIIISIAFWLASSY